MKTNSSIVKKLISCFLVCFVLLTTVIPAQAAEVSNVFPEDNNNDCAPASLIFPDIYDGPGGVQYYLLYNMNCAQVTEVLISSVSGKCFMPKNYTTQGAVAIHLVGTLTQSQGVDVRIGLAEYDAWFENYPAVCDTTVDSGTSFDERISIANVLNSNTTYYTFVANSSTGYTTGTIATYYSKA